MIDKCEFGWGVIGPKSHKEAVRAEKTREINWKMTMELEGTSLKWII